MWDKNSQIFKVFRGNTYIFLYTNKSKIKLNTKFCPSYNNMRIEKLKCTLFISVTHLIKWILMNLFYSREKLANTKIITTNVLGRVTHIKLL